METFGNCLGWIAAEHPDIFDKIPNELLSPAHSFVKLLNTFREENIDLFTCHMTVFLDIAAQHGIILKLPDTTEEEFLESVAIAMDLPDDTDKETRKQKAKVIVDKLIKGNDDGTR